MPLCLAGAPLAPPRPPTPADCAGLVGTPEPDCSGLDPDDPTQRCALANCVYEQRVWGARCFMERRLASAATSQHVSYSLIAAAALTLTCFLVAAVRAGPGSTRRTMFALTPATLLPAALVVNSLRSALAKESEAKAQYL